MVLTTSFALLPGNEPISGEDQYEFDVPECLNRLRYGRILALTATWSGFGNSASVAEEIVRMITIYGKVKVKEIKRSLAGDGGSIREYRS